MRRGRLLREEQKSDVNVTPLLDVVFILLIFFLVTASFIKESAIELGRFDAPLSTPVSTQSQNIFVALDGRGGVWVNHRPVSLSALRANIEKLHADNPDAKVIVMADPASRNGLLVRVIDTARVAGLYDVSLAAAE
jgi:biopolymer transport protein ExbD